MAHKTQGVCPMAAAALIRAEVKRRGVSQNLAILQISRELEIPVETLRSWMWPERHKKSRRKRTFWEKVLAQLRAGAKAVRLHGTQHPLDDEIRAELKAMVRYLGEFILRQEAEDGKVYLAK